MTEKTNKPEAKIIIVEDDIIIAADLESRLKSQGYTVCGKAAIAEKALDLVERHQPDLVLMDIVLRGQMDGIEAAELIKDRWGIPVVFLTAYADTVRLERAKLTYPFGYILKPFQERDLKITVEMALYVARADVKRKKAEESLRESEEKIRLAMEATTDGMWDWNIETGYVFYSPAWSRILGLYEVKPDYQAWSSRIHPEDKKTVFQGLEANLEKETGQWSQEHRLRTGEGTWKWVLGRGRVVARDDAGHPVRMVGTMTDISERKQAELELETRNRELETLYKVSKIALRQNPLRSTLGEIGQEVAAALGFPIVTIELYDGTRQEMECMAAIGMPMPDGDGVLKVPADQTLSGVVARTGQPLVELRVMDRPENVFEALRALKIQTFISVPMLVGSRVIGVLSLASPSTMAYEERILPLADSLANFIAVIIERKHTEEALEESERLYRFLFENLLNGFAYCRMFFENGKPRDFMYLAVNQAFEDQTGLKDVAGKWVSEVVPGIREKDPELFELYGRVASTGRPERFEVFVKAMSMWFAVSVYSPKPEHFVAIFDVINERKRAEKEKEKLQSQLQQAQKMEAIGTLAGGVSHDFNNLLQAINGYTQILLMDKTRDAPEYSSLMAILKAGERAAELVRQLLLFSRKVETERKPIILNREVEHARKILERTIPKMIDLDFNMGHRLWAINADPVQMEQILLNLSTNAADAMPEGGRLLIETENIVLTREDNSSYLVMEPGSYVLLTVSDTGHGMDRETVQHIFEPFFTTKEIGKGTGLGLASVYGIVKGHGGYINCYSEAGQGTTFKIYLPAIEQIEQTSHGHLKKGPLASGSEMILLVDDEESIKDFAKQALTRFGYLVLTASSGEEALEIYLNRSKEIDLVILDLGMPGMGGYKCLLEIIKFNPVAKVLIASGYSANGQVKMTLEAGAAGYVGKPYKLTDLLDKVRQVLDGEE